MGEPVHCYAGYVGEERPVSFLFEGERIEVHKILSRWRDPTCDYFSVAAPNAHVYILAHNRTLDTWAVERSVSVRPETAPLPGPGAMPGR